MATYNGERFLQEQLDSLAAQTYLPCELVVGDDGSTDGTLEILERFVGVAPFRVRIRRNPVRLGYGENFLSTASQCTGDWIAFCDQDDVWLPQKLKRFATAAIADPVVDFIVCENILLDASLERRLPRGFSVAGARWMPLTSPVRIHDGHRMAFRRHYIQLPWENRPVSIDGKVLSHDRWIGALAWLIGKRAFLSESLILHRKHPSAFWAENSDLGGHNQNGSGHARGLAVKSYMEREHLWRSTSRWCRETAQTADAALAQRLVDAVSKSNRIADWYRLRAMSHSPDRLMADRLAAVGKLLCNGAYLKGFGLTPFAKDLAAAALHGTGLEIYHSS